MAKNHTIGIAFQHLSNAGIQQLNGGINFVLVQYGLRVPGARQGNYLDLP